MTVVEGTSKKDLLETLDKKSVFLPSVMQEFIKISSLLDGKNLSKEQIVGLLNEATLQEYNLQRQRNDPDAMFTSPEYKKESFTDNVYEKIGRATEPKSIYSYTEPSTLQMLAGLMGAQAYYNKGKDELVYPNEILTNKQIKDNPELASKISREDEAHEYMHRGFKESPIRKPTVENPFHRKYVRGTTADDEHLYIYAKSSPERLDEYRQKFYPNVDKDDFYSHLNKIIKRIDEKRAKIAQDQLQDMLNNF